ncbi:hypothetical protein ACO0LG_28545 [Undibacterium sp. Ji42W]|uniref:hypothetical protein n=1 Tax=Undibacterium sp. Ji42W TaxID=3413039 RepID=UPI003BF18D3A
MTLLQKYIHAVKQVLPLAQREDIGRELQANILDQLDALQEQTGREATEQEVARILEKLGHPAQVAARYIPVTPLVSSELMPSYKLVTNYALGIALLLQTLKSGTVFLQAEHDKIWQALMQLIAGFFDQATMIFTSVTIAFYLVSKSGMLPIWGNNRNWRAQDLSEQEYDWQNIRGSDVLTDLSSCGFILLLIWHASWMSEASLQQLRVDFSPSMASYLPWMSVLLLFSIAFCIWCAVQPVWSKLKLQLNIVQNVLYAALFFLFSQLDAVIHNIGWPAILDLQRLDRGIRLACLAYALYLLYECVRDGRRFLQLGNRSTDVSPTE